MKTKATNSKSNKNTVVGTPTTPTAKHKHARIRCEDFVFNFR
jgi:hypothetical protein